MTLVPVLLLTGFLGSGKTTLLNRLIASEAFRDTAVVINEAGLVGLDHLLVEAGEEDVVMLEGGCLCCRMRGSLANALAALLRRRQPDGTLPFRRIVVETSGLADPGPILQAIIADAGFGRRFTLAGVVTTIDARAFEGSFAGHPEVRMQVAFADRLLLTKTDLVPPEATEGVRAVLAAINPEARQAVVPPGPLDAASFWTEALAMSEMPTRRRRVAEDAGPTPAIATASLVFPGRLDPDAVDAWLDGTMQLLGPALLRMKALLHVRDVATPVVLHAVLGLLHAPGGIATAPDGLNRVVLIGRDVDEAVLHDVAERLAEQAEPARQADTHRPDGARVMPHEARP